MSTKQPKPQVSRETAQAARRIGTAIDHALENLPLWTLDRITALYYLLTTFEDAGRLPVLRSYGERDIVGLIGDADRRHRENSLVHLTNACYRFCPDARLKDVPSTFNWDRYDMASAALDFGTKYDLVTTGLESAMNGRENIRVSGQNVSFTFSSSTAIAYDAAANLAHMIGDLLGPSRPDPLPFCDLLNDPNSDTLIRQIRQATQPTDDTHIRYAIPSRAKRWFEDLADCATRVTELPLEMQVGGYTVKDAQFFHRYLYFRAAVQQSFCAFSAQRGGGVGSIVLTLTRPELERELVTTGGIASDAFENLVADLTYQPSLKHTDLYFQPLIEITSGTFIVSPTCITTSRWERNLQRLWAIRYPDTYGAAVGPIKVGLPRVIAAEFERRGFLAAANRPLGLLGCELETDADVAVFDAERRTLLVAEVKWFTETAEAREVRQADDEIARALVQVRTAKAFVESHAVEASSLLFAGHYVPPWVQCRIRTVVIARGHLPSEAVLDPEVPVLDFDLLQAYLRNTQERRSLDQIIDDLVSQLRQLRTGRAWRSDTIHVDLAGYSFELPGWKVASPALPPPPDIPRPAPNVGRNTPCPCGSGAKYKRCHGR